MKNLDVRSKPLAFMVLLALTGGLSACGNHFKTHSNLDHPPTATSDLLAAAKLKLAEGERDGEAEISLFDNSRDEDAFNTAMNDQEFDLAKHAEYLETHPEEAQAKEVPSYDDALPEDEAEAAADEKAVNPEAAPSVSAGGPSTKAPAKESAKQGDEPPAPAPSATATPAPTTPAPTKKRPRFKAIAVPAFAKDICQTTNIKSSSKENIDWLYVDNSPLPANLPAAALKEMESKKKQNQFICLLLPHALRMNAVVFNQRIYVGRLHYRHSKGTLKDADKLWLSKMKLAYNLKEDDSIEELLKKVDIVPLPMLLTQAAVESGWGTSKAVRETRNIFGMHSPDKTNCAPGYDTGGKSCIKIYPTITASVADYIRLLNRAKPYAAFRELRASFRKQNKFLDSERLMEKLTNYSERGAAYIANIKLIMSGHNKISKYTLDEAKMAENAPVNQPTSSAFAPSIR